MEKECNCGGKMIESDFFGFASVRVPNGYNFPKDYNIVPFVCEKCGKIEFYAGIRQNGAFIFGGIIG